MTSDEKKAIRVRVTATDCGEPIHWMCTTCRRAVPWADGACATCRTPLSDVAVFKPNPVRFADHFRAMFIVGREPMKLRRLLCPRCGKESMKVAGIAERRDGVDGYGLAGGCARAKCGFAMDVEPDWLPEHGH